MVKGCGNKCIKYFFWLLNFLFFVLGGIILGLSIWLRIDSSSLTNVANSVQLDVRFLENFYYLLYVTIGIGAALLILGFFGCCGSCCESVCTISIYFILVLILFVVEIVAVVLYFVNKQQLFEGFSTIFRNEFVAHYNTNANIQQILDQIQRNMQCCGAFGCNDYLSFGAFPSSCQCATLTQPGCATQLWNTLESNLIYVGIVGIIVLVVEIFAMIFSCVIISAVREKRANA
ncbi:unnamed protein product [Caenorhabditis bovis]|uniref:Tetraspanin n=1 Tax=Caenorhabditis bovis TaxID=2654633 RepID=A0A8S1EHI8_9PELO|nr:unnamed protein product [Caenorhabditis bovis]